MDWSHVDYCDVFISCLDSHSDGTHSLQRSQQVSKWYNFSKSVATIKQQTHLLYILDVLRVTKLSADLNFLS